ILNAEAAEYPERKYGAESEQGRAETCGKLIDPEEVIGRDLEPVKQRRFFEPMKAAKRRRDPIATFEHLAGDLGVPRLIGPQERHGEPEKIESGRRKREEQQESA